MLYYNSIEENPTRPADPTTKFPMHTSLISRCFNDKWSVLALMRFALASIVAITHLSDFGPLGVWAFIPMFGAFEAIAGFLVISGYSIGASYQKESKGFI